MDATKVVDLLAKAKNYELDANKLLTNVAVLKEEAQLLCTHTVTVEDSSYCSGGYDYTASTTTTTICAICGIHLSTHTKQHDYYG